MNIVILGIDLGKNSCSVVGLDSTGTVVVRRRLRRDGVIAFASKLPACVMALEGAAALITLDDRWPHWGTRFG